MGPHTEEQTLHTLYTYYKTIYVYVYICMIWHQRGPMQQTIRNNGSEQGSGLVLGLIACVTCPTWR